MSENEKFVVKEAVPGYNVGAPIGGPALVGTAPSNALDDLELATFEANILRVELWLSAMEDIVASPAPDLKKIRMHNLDIPEVLAEANNQLSRSDDVDLKNRYFSLLPRLKDYIWRSDDVLKGFPPRPFGSPTGPRTAAAPHSGQPPVPPPTPPVDNGKGGGDDGRMEKRIDKLEADMAAVKTDVAVIRSSMTTKDDLAKAVQDIALVRANYATKDELNKVAQDVAVIRSNYATKEDLHKELHGMTLKVIGSLAAFTAAVFFIARYVAPMPTQLPARPATVATAPAASVAQPSQPPAVK